MVHHRWHKVPRFWPWTNRHRGGQNLTVMVFARSVRHPTAKDRWLSLLRSGTIFKHLNILSVSRPKFLSCKVKWVGKKLLYYSMSSAPSSSSPMLILDFPRTWAGNGGFQTFLFRWADHQITSECTPQSSHGPERTVKMELEGKCAKQNVVISNGFHNPNHR
jgi:hypothetical protein